MRMKASVFVTPEHIRSLFAQAMSDMYRSEVPLYGTLMSLVAEVNAKTLDAAPDLDAQLARNDDRTRLDLERHGAIRVGKASELAMLRRLFAVMGMQPVGYYDLSVAGVPVHSTAFRPLTAASLAQNPFRVFTSLLRLELIEDAALRAQAEAILERRDIFTSGARELIERSERDGGLTEADARRFVAEALQTFRWHGDATVSFDVYRALSGAHRLIADVVCFRGPHINHLTPRTLDIDAIQTAMIEAGIDAKEVIEGPPRRTVPILLRQTSFKALQEPVRFPSDAGGQAGSHTARFGEIEQRGLALTPQGRALYDRLLNEARQVEGAGNTGDYDARMRAAFEAFPDDAATLRLQRLGYFRYRLTEAGRALPSDQRRRQTPDALVDAGLATADPIVYEDFLPVSAAGIFQSNLGDEAAQEFVASPNQIAFERDLGAPVLDEFAHYAGIEKASLENCLGFVNMAVPA